MAKAPVPPLKSKTPAAPAKGGKPMPPWLQKKTPPGAKAAPAMPAFKGGGKAKAC